MAKQKRIRVLVYHDIETTNNLQVKSCFDHVEIDNELSELQRLVDGYIEPVSICEFTRGKKTYSIDLVCNDEGKLNGLPYNAVVLYDHDKNIYDYIAGNFFIALCDVDIGDYIDMSNDIVDKLDKCFCACELSDLNGNVIKVAPLFVCQIIQKEFERTP